VDALSELGAKIAYPGIEGYPTLEIKGGLKKGGNITVKGGISSQFISALMMIGPALKGGLRITLSGDIVSSTYIRMTQALMQMGGIDVSFHGQHISIPEGIYHFDPFVVESDWSAASYWFQIAALKPGSVITLPHLRQDSLQGDSVLISLFETLGVKSSFEQDQLVLRSGNKINRALYEYDFTGCPDLAQTMATTLCAMGIPFRFKGTRTLRVKETDRVAALQNELEKFGFSIDADREGDWIHWDGSRKKSAIDPLINTYHDHRMAMAFAPLSILFGEILIDDPMVVTKSYPSFWKDLEKAGFRVSAL